MRKPMQPGRGGYVTNWGGNQSWRPSAFVRPSSEDDVAAQITKAAAGGGTVRAIGSAHSFTATAVTNGVQIELSNLDEVYEVDTTTKRVTVGAGMSILAFNELLAQHGLAMTNMGDIGYQSLAGAVSTGTHGTGAAYGGIATQIVGLRLIAADGSIHDVDESDPSLLNAARVSLGALGVITRVTIQCVDPFNLHAVETKHSLDDLLAGEWDEIAASTDHAEFFWMPGTRNALVKRNTRTQEPVRTSRIDHFTSRVLGENIGFGLVNRVGRRFPAAVPTIAKLVAGGSDDRDFVDRNDKVFMSPRYVKFVEMEYGLPVEDLCEAVGRINALCRELRKPITFPIEVRVAAADDIHLSTASGRDSGYVACHVYQGTSYDGYFQGVEAIMDDYAGRPHWGKVHFRTAAALRERYPKFDDFLAVRKRLDPEGVFANAYLDRVLGAGL
ncbi:MAG: FAD-binding protein [Acidimicrobiales bacterium]|nr:FAD-binding protein [Acidimicrobiales bacterium]